MTDEYIKCTFCDDNAGAVLTFISKGNIVETAFCENHMMNFKCKEYNFNILKEPDQEESFVFPDYENSKIIKESNPILIEDVDDVDCKIEELKDMKDNLLFSLKEEMERYIKKEDFNEAIKIRDKIKTIEGDNKNEAS